MCDFFDWERDDADRKDAHEEFKSTLVHQFNHLYGTDPDDIQTWQGLCMALCIRPLPKKIDEAMKV